MERCNGVKGVVEEVDVAWRSESKEEQSSKRCMAEGKDDGRGLTVKDLDPYSPGRTTCWEQHVMERLPGSPR